MYKIYTIYYKTFLQDEVIQNEWTEAVNLTPVSLVVLRWIGGVSKNKVGKKINYNLLINYYL
jgi:hypothetical protein